MLEFGDIVFRMNQYNNLFFHTLCRKINFFRKFSTHLVFFLLFLQMYMTRHCACHFIIRSTENGSSWGWKYLGNIRRQRKFIPSKNQTIHIWNGFKYCYWTLIILFNINHLFVRRLDGFNYCYFSVVDPHPLPSCTFKIKLGWVLVCHKSNFENTAGTIVKAPIWSSKGQNGVL